MPKGNSRQSTADTILATVKTITEPLVDRLTVFASDLRDVREDFKTEMRGQREDIKEALAAMNRYVTTEDASANRLRFEAEMAKEEALSVGRYDTLSMRMDVERKRLDTETESERKANEARIESVKREREKELSDLKVLIEDAKFERGKEISEVKRLIDGVRADAVKQLAGALMQVEKVRSQMMTLMLAITAPIFVGVVIAVVVGVLNHALLSNPGAPVK